MSFETGLLLDVSDSMSKSIGDGVDVQDRYWIESIFTVIDEFVKHDLSDENRLFAIAFGGSRQHKKIFDILRTIEQFQDQMSAKSKTIDEILKVLEQSGARNIRKWLDIKTAREEIKEFQAQLVLERLKENSDFRERFVSDILPSSCRDTDAGLVRRVAQNLSSSVASTFRKASREEIRDITKKAFDPMRSSLLISVSNNSASVSVKKATEIIHSCVDANGITTRTAHAFLEILKPLIFGLTNLHAALEMSTDQYVSISSNLEVKCHRLLFVLSDGSPTDRGDMKKIRIRLQDKGVIIVGCYISRSDDVTPRRLYNVSEGKWTRGAMFLFNLSSHIPTETVTRAIFIKHGWQIDIENNETRLFMQVNHPDHIKDACKLARNAVCCQDALSEVLVTVSLDLYINRSNAEVRVHDQGQEATCYAHAAATVVHLAMRRILGRDGGYPDFEQLRDDMISRHGRQSANTFQVLQEICPQYRLRCRQVIPRQALQAIAEKRLVVARFRLTNDKWEVFDSFYHQNPQGILRKADLERASSQDSSVAYGHAVVLTSYNSQCLILMNSYGDGWGDNGFFRVENADTLGLEFIDVYWDESDLSQQEKANYHANGAEVASNLIRSLKSLQSAMFTCPHCHTESNVNEYRGTLLKAFCPRCNRSFSSHDGKGNLLALNMYLTSLSNP